MIYVFQINANIDYDRSQTGVFHVEMLVGSDIEDQILSILNKAVDKVNMNIINYLYVDTWLDGKHQKQSIYDLDSLNNIRKIS